jgi:hypothetical protein
MLGIESSSRAQDHAKFEPPAGKQLLIIGQDLGAIGGFEAPNNDGYSDHMEAKPGGVTTYTSITQLEGLDDPTNYGSGNSCARDILHNPIYANSVLAIGLYMVDSEKNMASGAMDDQIYNLAKWIKRAHRPVFLRIGFEFDGPWNHFDPAAYKGAYQRIVTIFKKMSVNNCATVWQSAAIALPQGKKIDDWYPGDDAVDYVGYSWFGSSSKKIEVTDNLLAFAKAHHKPVMICESADQGFDNVRLTFRNINNGQNPVPKTPDEIWKSWYAPYFDYIEKNKDVIKVVAYINVNWDIQAMWGPPYKMGYWGDTRVEVNPVIKAKWIETISQPKWMLSSPTLFSDLGFTDE